VHHQLSTVRDESSLSTWIYRVATNLCLDHFRKKSSRHDQKTESLGISIESDGPASGALQSQEDPGAPCADEVVIKAEMNACIRNYIDQLPEDYRAVIILSELQDLRNQEIAEILECSLKTVKIRLHRARKRLKETLEAHCTFYYNTENTLCCDKKQ
jgi:RNA polymerase sigma-70 factor (ECF subfamily)